MHLQSITTGRIVHWVSATERDDTGRHHMRTYEITSSEGVYFGAYEAETVADALNAMARDAGYRDADDAASQVGAFEGTITEV